MGDLLPAQVMRSGCSAHDGVDGCPHQQQDSGVGTRAAFSSFTPVGHRVMDEQPDKGGPQEGQDHEDGPLRPHSPGGGAIWAGREHADGSLPLVPSPHLPVCLLLPDTLPRPEPLIGGLVLDTPWGLLPAPSSEPTLPSPLSTFHGLTFSTPLMRHSRVSRLGLTPPFQ